MAGFMAPEEIGTTRQSLFLVLPIIAAIAIIYKATKVPRVSIFNFIKETFILFLSITAFLVLIALILAAVARFVTQ
jgi:hypothetical protein